MAVSLFSLIPEKRMDDVLSNLQEFTGLSIQLVSSRGELIRRYGEPFCYCRLLQKNAFPPETCGRRYVKAGKRAQSLGESYIFNCPANLNSIAFPLVNKGEFLGSVMIGPFLLDTPDSSIVSDLAEKYRLTSALALELFDELRSVPVMTPAKANQLMKLADHLLSPLLPGERALLLESQQKMFQQSRLNETIQVYKEQEPDQSLEYFNKKEKDLLAKVRTGSVTDVKALLNDLIGHIMFSEGADIRTIRVRFIELTTLLSRVAIDGGARTDSIYRLNSQFIEKLYMEQTLENVCIQMQEVLESFMNAMFSEIDKGNPYVRKALRYMHDNYSAHLDLEKVAEYVGLSPSYFSSLFHKIVGESFRDRLNRIRVEESKRLLLSARYSLGDIAVAMGFPDQSYYSKVFKKIIGVTPGKYRE